MTASELSAYPMAPTQVDEVVILSGRARRAATVLREVWHRPGLLLALAALGLVLLAAVGPTLLSAYDPNATAPLQRLQPPSAAHWFGTDQLGRDLFARVVHGTRLSVLASLLAVAIAVGGGGALGLLAGFFGGRTDAVVMRLVDILLAMPALLLALAIVTAIGFGTVPVAVAVGLGILPGIARTMRAEVLRVKTLPFVEAARLSGAGPMFTLVNHILPNSSAAVAVLATLDVGLAILITSGLSFLGFGAAPPAAEWGTLIAQGRSYLVTAPWVATAPGLFVAATVFALNHVARSIEDVSR